MKKRGARKDVDRLVLSDGDWVDVRLELSVGDEREYLSLSITGMSRDGEMVKADPFLQQLGELAQRIIGWSFIGHDDAPLPYRADADLRQRIAWIGALDTDTRDEINAALKTRLEVGEAIKKSHGSTIGIVPTSPLPSGSDVVTTT